MATIDRTSETQRIAASMNNADFLSKETEAKEREKSAITNVKQGLASLGALIPGLAPVVAVFTAILNAITSSS